MWCNVAKMRTRIWGGAVGVGAALMATSAVALGAGGFVAGATYTGTTSQKPNTITVKIATNGRTAAVVAGMRAKCTGKVPHRHTIYGGYTFDALFKRNPARISGSRMSVTETDHRAAANGHIPATTRTDQSFAARASSDGLSLHGSYSYRAALPNGQVCATGRVTFTARTR